MPLHLLGKKSWNVYNHDNIEKVRRDEAAAEAREEAEEQRIQEVDAERRIKLLRGEVPEPIPAPPNRDGVEKRRPEESRGPGRGRKRQKMSGEDDTEYEYRVANEDLHKLSHNDQQLVLRKPTSEAPLTDTAGHINLFPQEHRQTNVAKNSEAEKELAKKKKEYEDQYTMRFSNAAGLKQGLEKPWYSRDNDVAEEAPSKDVWGNGDPKRKERQAARTVSNDPLAAMKQGASRVRNVERERRKWQEERDKDIGNMIEEEKARARRNRRRREEDPASLTKENHRSSREYKHRDKRSHGDRSSKRSHRHRSRSLDRHGHDDHKDRRHSQD